jgi:hypothetical protein
MGRQPALWLAVAGVAVLAQPVFRLVADSKVGDALPALRDLNYYSTRKNG